MPITDDDRARVYEIVAARHAQWDNLLWQIPVLSMTAQAFLFSISLSPGSSSGARLIASALSALTLFLSATSMARQRQASLTDAEWLSSYEADWADGDKQFGDAWARRRDARKDLEQGPIGQSAPRIKMFRTWIIAFWLFLIADVVVVILSVTQPQSLNAG